MGDGHDEFDVAHAFASHFLFGNFYTTSVADNALVADAFVFSAMAFVVFDRTKNALAEETVALGLVCAVVYCLGFENLTARLFENLLGRSKPDGDFREGIFRFIIFSKSHMFY